MISKGVPFPDILLDTYLKLSICLPLVAPWPEPWPELKIKLLKSHFSSNPPPTLIDTTWLNDINKRTPPNRIEGGHIRGWYCRWYFQGPQNTFFTNCLSSFMMGWVWFTLPMKPISKAPGHYNGVVRMKTRTCGRYDALSTYLCILYKLQFVHMMWMVITIRIEGFLPKNINREQ